MKLLLSWPILLYLRLFAKLALFIAKPGTIIGITGSLGKSSTRNALDAILKNIAATKTVYEGNSETGIPLGLLGIKIRDYSFFGWLQVIIRAPFGIFHLRGIRYLIVEMGIDDPTPPKNMAYLLTIIKPDISVFLNVFAVHTEQFEKKLAKVRLTASYEEEIVSYMRHIAYEKGRLITENDNCKVAIYNKDNDLVYQSLKEYRQKAPAGVRFYSFGKKRDSVLVLSDFSVSLHGTTMSFELKKSPSLRRKFSLHFAKLVLPQVYHEVCGAAILASLACGVPLEKSIQMLERHMVLPHGRGSIFSGIHDSMIIDSTYNASKESVLAYLNLMESLKSALRRPSVFIFGDMKELGSASEGEHGEVARRCDFVDHLYCVGPLTKAYVVPYIQSRKRLKQSKVCEIRWFEDAIKLGNYLKDNLPQKSIVLAKGSQNGIYLEETVKMLLKKKEDQNKLCRQSDFWMKKKASFFS